MYVRTWGLLCGPCGAGKASKQQGCANLVVRELLALRSERGGVDLKLQRVAAFAVLDTSSAMLQELMECVGPNLCTRLVEMNMQFIDHNVDAQVSELALTCPDTPGAKMERVSLQV